MEDYTAGRTRLRATRSARAYVLVTSHVSNPVYVVYNIYGLMSKVQLNGNLRDKDNLSTKDKCLTPSVSIVWRFHCTLNIG